ncbi:hypothetical protein BO79DRAFT_37842 [Aspergillus costaricaensis CBS 115574]|uniref:Uncharacterized protein n=1 Tax=Aspergillus costaricaensis CBS 115574 TaxID=1448317 RepID=A0ACD1I953_9EURO|nr:hypothetical protein BO79DRAFT_37842 [Aspergillus costaricaensis CBS 115574]RAK86302.1 hypothetical protein BO79DRAFT_37842 [Aspergillus costaricaensis CBS 115574]
MASCWCDKQGNAIGCGTIAIKTGRSALVALDKTNVTDSWRVRTSFLIFVFFYFCISLQSNIGFVAGHGFDSPGIPHPVVMMGLKGKEVLQFGGS